MNREQRRHPENHLDESEPDATKPQSTQQGLVKQGPPDVQDPRAKASRHGKTTADKWNQ